MTDDTERRSILAQQIDRAAAAVRQAVRNHRQVAALQWPADAVDLTYTPSAAGYEDRKFVFDGLNAARRFADDPVLHEARAHDEPLTEVQLLANSPHWQDRVRAKALLTSIVRTITLPPGFPCIYEPADSPRKADHKYPEPFVWVASPDEEMLREVLPLYRELWASYESQWPTSPSRTFEVGRLDGISPHGVFRPGATPEDVIAATLITHSDMYRRAPEHLKKMHPMYDSWARHRDA